ncbi:hypothetical protein TK11N_02330 [Tetragenococcus koreensis]|uniref:Uncharacterized protein n=1 Tax=Tetragenococcus koreensis TaxID=290335 RepID=A0AAN4RIT8_9ENTE|nr:hypothetical protein TK11N_02330 [Tetragenococcus koreensis]GEQ50889.1 hypothetical protein TK12N_02330 [Tetragenococcus koreensis]GEQ53492.1 hypothetical protein TK2N_03360 [Tetragenococcus koreensis]GEQ55993.1 hypothetical protein TK4N_03360 [Tetragenococcus koreensis]GEQ58497.1 hypothetical protein TK6N_03360 [Tetragenococcus koreensis]
MIKYLFRFINSKKIGKRINNTELIFRELKNRYCNIFNVFYLLYMPFYANIFRKK